MALLQRIDNDNIRQAMKIHKQFGMSYKLMSRLIEMVEDNEINKDHPIFKGQYEKMKRQLLREVNNDN